MKPGLRLLVAEHRDRGAEEGSLDAARLASRRRPLVRGTSLPAPDVAPVLLTPRAVALAAALRELDALDQEGDDGR